MSVNESTIDRAARTAEGIGAVKSLMRANPDMTVSVVESHFGVDVHVNPLMEALRPDQCLCLNCGRLDLNPADNCKNAQALYELCVKNNLAMAVTRCPNWIQKVNEPK
jgi:hypothetical protein